MEVCIHLPGAQGQSAHSARETHPPNFIDPCPGKNCGIFYMSVGHGLNNFRCIRPSPVWITQEQFYSPCPGRIDPPLATGSWWAREGLECAVSGLQQGLQQGWPQNPAEEVSQHRGPRLLGLLVYFILVQTSSVHQGRRWHLRLVYHQGWSAIGDSVWSCGLLYLYWWLTVRTGYYQVCWWQYGVGGVWQTRLWQSTTTGSWPVL